MVNGLISLDCRRPCAVRQHKVVGAGPCRKPMVHQSRSARLARAAQAFCQSMPTTFARRRLANRRTQAANPFSTPPDRVRR